MLPKVLSRLEEEMVVLAALAALTVMMMKMKMILVEMVMMMMMMEMKMILVEMVMQIVMTMMVEMMDHQNRNHSPPQRCHILVLSPDIASNVLHEWHSILYLI